MKYTSFSTLTVAQYQELYSVNTSDIDDVEKAISCVSILTGLPRWEVEELPLADFNKVSSELAIIFAVNFEPEKPKEQIKIAGKKYIVQLNPRKITAGQYIDIMHFSKSNMVENLHRVIACLIVPKLSWGKVGKYNANKHEELSEAVREMRFIDINSICVFFLKLWNVSTKVIQDYLKKELSKISETNPDLKSRLREMDLQKLLDGSILLKE
jgi:hypothetical protein